MVSSSFFPHNESYLIHLGQRVVPFKNVAVPCAERGGATRNIMFCALVVAVLLSYAPSPMSVVYTPAGRASNNAAVGRVLPNRFPLSSLVCTS